MNREERHRARLRLVSGMARGEPWREAAERAGCPTSRSTAYRLLRAVRAEGKGALAERRHGHASKVRQPVKDWLVTHCQAHPGTPSSALRAELRARFGLAVSISQLNRVRATLGIGNRPQGVGGKSAARQCS